MRWSKLLWSALLSGSFASPGSTATLALAARAEGKRAWQPINATSHSLNGNATTAYREVDQRHTGLPIAAEGDRELQSEQTRASAFTHAALMNSSIGRKRKFRSGEAVGNKRTSKLQQLNWSGPLK